MVRPSRRKAVAVKAVKERGICIRVACQAFRISESCYRYERKRDPENEEVATWLMKLTDNNRNWGFGLCYLYLRNLTGFKWNHRRVYRVYKEWELNLRIKHRKRLTREKPETLTVLLAINQVWSMAFMHNLLEDDRTLRLLNVIDGYNREAIGMEADVSLPAERVIRELKQMISWRGKPQVIRCKTVLNISAPRFRTGLQNGELSLNTFNQATHSKMLILKDLKEQFATNGCHNITGQA